MQPTTHKNQSNNSENFAHEFQKLSHFREPVYAKGQEIYNAAVEGAKRGYNRSTDDYTRYEELLSKVFEQHLNTCSDRTKRRSIMRNTKGDWRNAYLPITLMMQHKHKAGIPCEAHARVCLPPNYGAIFDIPLESWSRIAARCPLRFKR